MGRDLCRGYVVGIFVWGGIYVWGFVWRGIYVGGGEWAFNGLLVAV